MTSFTFKNILKLFVNVSQNFICVLCTEKSIGNCFGGRRNICSSNMFFPKHSAVVTEITFLYSFHWFI